MRKNKKLLLASVAAMGALALGVGATSTFAWYQANASSVTATASSGKAITTSTTVNVNAVVELNVSTPTRADSKPLELTHYCAAISAGSLAAGDVANYNALFNDTETPAQEGDTISACAAKYTHFYQDNALKLYRSDDKLGSGTLNSTVVSFTVNSKNCTDTNGVDWTDEQIATYLVGKYVKVQITRTDSSSKALFAAGTNSSADDALFDGVDGTVGHELIMYSPAIAANTLKADGAGYTFYVLVRFDDGSAVTGTPALSSESIDADINIAVSISDTN